MQPTASRLWSPLILAIFLTCFHNVLTRHRIRHHRDRFKRQQGANLYLPGSYVFDGETAGAAEAGPWEPWSTPSPCSRSCGGGVSTELRQCTPGFTCQGPSAKHFSCNTQDCPDQGDFRAQQCAEYDNIPFNDRLYQWIPYFHLVRVCQLNCQARGERWYHPHRAQVIDGTRCNEDNFDVCVQGKCQPVGCDMMLGSNIREDACRVCGGDGSTCNTINEIFNKTDLTEGYKDFLLIPRGATNILVEETRPSNNFLAVRNNQKANKWYLNGNWMIDLPGRINFASCNFNYERSSPISANNPYAPDRLTCRGPTDEALVIALLIQEENVGVHYKYSIPNSIQSGAVGENETYAWTFDQFSACSRTCGGGTQTRNVTCAGRRTLEPVDPNLCDSNYEPKSAQACAEIACGAQWTPYPWGNCSWPCGDGGVQTRAVACQRIDANGFPQAADEAECFESGPKPPVQQQCNKGRICAKWHTAPWAPCDHLCGDGAEKRRVRCYRSEKEAIELLADEECPDERPASERKCQVRPCEGLDWITSEWSGCDKCGLTQETRKTLCATAGGESYEEGLCDAGEKPETVRPCDSTPPNCEYNWYASQWSECSAQCGQGVQTRTLFCGVIGEDKKVEKVENAKCDQNKLFDTSRNCTGEVEKCPGEWFSGPWTDCSKPCGGGERARKVVCLKDFEVVDVDQCNPDKIVFKQEECNTQSCSEDTIIPTDVSQSVDESDEGTTIPPSSPASADITDISDSTDKMTTLEDDSEYEIVPADECDDGEWVDAPDEDNETTEQMAPLLGSSTESSQAKGETDMADDDLMVNDAPAADTETEAVSGSGDGSTTESLSSSISTLEEGSGDTESTSDSSTQESSTTESSSTTEDSNSTTVTSSDITDSSDSTDITSETSETPISTESTESSLSTESGATTESGTTEVSGSTITETTGSTESTITETSGSTESTITETTGSTESTVTGSTESTITETTGSTESTVTGSTESTITETTGSTESTITETTGSTESTITETTGSTESTITETTGSTESTITETTGSTESSISTEYDIWSSTSSSSDETTDVWSTTPITDIFGTVKQRMCKRRKEKSCTSTKHGCCWDKITPAQGPFDGGCPTPHTCKESVYGCCEDGVSAALGRNNKGCPPSKCNETLFGCCPDKKTPAEGPKNEGCPAPPPACLKSKFGCCKDNTTAAKGPKQKGCQQETAATTLRPQDDCRNSTFGCCPDGASVATGANFNGCDIFKPNCTESYFKCCPDNETSAQGPNFAGCCAGNAFGCCPDGVTPAHGYNQEGCCLSSAYKCCPDNILAARGPNLEGCGCQYAPYGCCPDNVTAARGYAKEGCGCQFTEYGCCPDNYSPAAGPAYAGCLCHTFQFGCCPDGVSIAKGPHQQGCGCRNTEFGCCSDDSTPAQGANFAGCGCDSSKFGCCPDGTSEAQGEDFDGCGDIPPNLQEGCGKAKERGACHDYVVKWYYDMEYGGCNRFWYSGCDGNNNRFRSKEECDGVCVSPEGMDRCKLPKVAGNCEEYVPQWYYDNERRSCAQFVYRGCLGNNNRFETREECQALCVRDESVDACEQERDEGPCRGQYRRWYYDKGSKMCQQFVYGGCKANNNNFPTEEACKQQCSRPDRKKDLCSLPIARGSNSCTERQARWYFDIPSKLCRPFYYSGCNGNDNNFISREACESDCPKEIEKDTCHLAAEVGGCANYTTRWYFDTRERNCRQFYYGGCEGNANNFATQPECEQRCLHKTPPSPPPEEQRPITRDECLLPSEAGDCQRTEARFFYDRTDGACKPFDYGGCGGNRNNFRTLQDCFYQCGATLDICTLPPTVGPCNNVVELYYYDNRTGTCEPFKYGGCQGNYNRFEDKAVCENRCRQAPPPVVQPVQTPAPPLYEPNAQCSQTPDPGNCNDSLTLYFYEPSTRLCQPFSYSGCGGNANRFVSEEQCERQCGKFQRADVCGIGEDAGPCRQFVIKYYFNRAAGSCGQFYYGGCGGNGNRFSSQEECESICVGLEETRSSTTSTAVCKLAPEQGASCRDVRNHVRWYFEENRRDCIAFSYTGCGGNLNNFKTYQSCIDFCRELNPMTEPPVRPDDHPCQVYFDECTTLRCPYGIEAYVDQNECNRCHCLDPCRQYQCEEGTQCAIQYVTNKTASEDPSFLATCRPITKAGVCPEQPQVAPLQCDQECRNDADCDMELKCCTFGCRTACVVPYENVPAEIVTQSYQPPAPYEPQYSPPQADVGFEPEVRGLIGDAVTIRCAVSGNPTPHISWRKGDLMIDGTEAKYRIKLDQTLQIVTLHTTDSGIYVCTADNNIGDPIQKEIKLEVVDDGNSRPASVLEQEDQPNVVVNLNAPATLHCFALGYPFPAVTWWNNDTLLPLKTSQFEVRQDYSLVISSVKLSNLGIYTCQAYNGFGKAASWSVMVKARGPYYSTNPNDLPYLKYIVNPPEEPAEVGPRYNNIPNEVPLVPDLNVHTEIVPVKTNISLEAQRFPTNSDVSIPCNVEGYPTPQVQWYKDGVPLGASERIIISENHKLTILRALKSDSGTYQCEASNLYSSASSSASILVDGIYIHPSCKDNRFFANCELIVKAKYCSHHYYAKFCCRSCTEAGMLPNYANNLV